MALSPYRAALVAALLVPACVDPPGTTTGSDTSTGSDATTTTTTATASTTEPASTSQSTSTTTTSTSSSSSTSTTSDTSDTTSGSTTTDVVDTTIATTNASASGGDQTATCECIIPEPIGLGSFDWQTCGWGPCGTIELMCLFDGQEPFDPDELCPFGSTALLDLEALDCSLQLLIDGTPGMVHFTEILGIPLTGGFVKIGEGRTGVSRTYIHDDIGGGDSPAERIELKDAAYFLGCKQLADPGARFKCLKDWSSGSVLATCDEAGQYSNW